MKLAHFYHCFCVGTHWEDVLLEHVAALEQAGIESPVRMGLVGKPEQRSRALCMVPNSKQSAEATKAWEQLTLGALRLYALSHPDEAILYAHSKGSANLHPFQEAWRRSMTKHVVLGWENCIRQLERGYDVVGCHYLSHADYPQLVKEGDYFFGGNFWIAKASYIASLPPCPMDHRWWAEAWIGMNKPKAYDLLEGWPSFKVFERGGTT